VTRSELIAELVARRDRLCDQYAALLAEGRRFAAEDMLPDIKFAIRAAYEAMLAAPEVP
jgi:hypothetical protein